MSKNIKYLSEFTTYIKKEGLYPDIPIVEGAAADTKINIKGKKYHLFSSNNYLGMSSHPEVKEAMKKAVERYGMGSGGPRLFAGNTDIHNELEATIAEYVGREASICFTTGFMANIGTIPALIRTPVVKKHQAMFSLVKKKLLGNSAGNDASIISEEKNHGSIIDGIRLSGAQSLIYKHRDVNDLKNKLSLAKGKKKVLITDGVFSMDGDIAPLSEIVQLAKKYETTVMVDDAHGIGVLGKRGRGTIEHFHVDGSDVEVLLGTFTKAFGGIGGFVAGSKEFVDYLRISARTYLLSAPLPPSIAAGLNRSIKIVSSAEGDEKRKRAWKNARYFRNSVESLGFKTLGSETLIIPVLIGKEKNAIDVTKKMFEMGIVAPNARFPAVPLSKARLRFVMTSEHTKDDIDYLLQSLGKIKHFAES